MELNKLYELAVSSAATLKNDDKELVVEMAGDIVFTLEEIDPATGKHRQITTTAMIPANGYGVLQQQTKCVGFVNLLNDKTLAPDCRFAVYLQGSLYDRRVHIGAVTGWEATAGFKIKNIEPRAIRLWIRDKVTGEFQPADMSH